MNPDAASVPWGQLFGVIALETALLVAAAFVLQRFIRSAAWRRTLWQATLLGLLLLIGAEVSGAGRLALNWVGRENPPETSARVIAQTSFTETTDLKALLVARAKEIAVAAENPVSEIAPSHVIVWWPGWIWLLGFGAVAAWTVVARLAFLVLVRRRAVTEGVVFSCVAALARRMDIRWRVRISETPGLAGPIAFGIIRPAISVPPEFARRFSEAQQEAMLAHELAHLAAHDPFWHALADLVAGLLWWHPLVWLARRQLRTANEVAADEACLLVKNGPVVLAGCLVELGRYLTRARPFGGLGIEGDNFRSGLGRRVKRLFTLKGRPWRPIRRTNAWLAKSIGPLVMVVLALILAAWIQPQTVRAETLRQAFQRSVLGLALAAAMPDPQNDVSANLPVDAAPDNADKIDWQPWSREAVAVARSEGRPVLVNFTADWAVTSLINESTSLEVPLVRAKLRELGAIALRADYTTVSDEIAAELRAFDRAGVPLVVVYSPDVGAAPQILPTVLTPQAVIAALEQATARSTNSTVNSSAELVDGRKQNKVPAIILEGRLLYEAGKLAEAEVKWREALRLDPKSAAAKHYLSLLETGLAPTVVHRTNSVPTEFAGRPALHSRWFKVNPNTIREGLRRVRFPTKSSPGFHETLMTNAASHARMTAADEIIKDARQLFTSAGVDFTAPGKQMSFNDRSGQLMVRATLQDLEIIERTIQAIKTPSQQVTVEVKFCEIRDDAMKAVGFDWIFGKASSNGPNTNTSSDGPFTGVLTDSQYRVILRALEQRSGVNVMSLPRVTTLSGRQAQVKSVMVRHLVTGLETSDNHAANPQPVTERFELGPVLDVVPHVQPRGDSIHMTLAASQQEFIGYDFDDERRTVTRSDGRKELVKGGEPRPIFRNRLSVSTAVVGTGQTVVLWGGSEQFTTNPKAPLLGDLPFVGRLFHNNGGRSDKTNFVVFVTATVVDEAGNRIPLPENLVP